MHARRLVGFLGARVSRVGELVGLREDARRWTDVTVEGFRPVDPIQPPQAVRDAMATTLLMADKAVGHLALGPPPGRHLPLMIASEVITWLAVEHLHRPSKEPSLDCNVWREA
jgi:hypothetical protein